MDALPQAMLFLGIIPALVLLFISLKGYDEYYKEKTIFLTFVVGIVAGFISVLIEAYTMTVGILFIILFPVLEQLFKTMILNIGRFHGQKSTPIYGLSLGLGFGSIFTPFSIIVSDPQGGYSMYLIGLVVLGSFGMILLHAATGVCIGYGVYTYKLTKYLLFAILLYLPVTATIFITTLFDVGYLQVAIVPYGLIVYWYFTTKIMNQIRSKSEKRKRSKNKK